MIVEYADISLDLSAALALLEDKLDFMEVWEVHVQIELGDYEGALRQMAGLAVDRWAEDVVAMLSVLGEMAELTDDDA